VNNNGGGTPDTAIFVGHTISRPCVIINVARHLTKSFFYIIRNCGQTAIFYWLTMVKPLILADHPISVHKCSEDSSEGIGESSQYDIISGW